MKNLFGYVLILILLPAVLWAEEPIEQAQPSVAQQIADSQQPGPLVDINIDRSVIEAIELIGEDDKSDYTLGANDSVEIKMQNHPELSGAFLLNSEGKIQYEFVGEVALGGMTLKEAEEKVKTEASRYVINPRVNMKITGYQSKAVYVMGQVSKPGKYYMNSERISVREAIIAAGMPIPGSAMHRTKLVTPGNKNSETAVKIVDLNALLQKGDLQYNYDMQSGDQLYVPTTQEEMDSVQINNEETYGSDEAEVPVPKSDLSEAGAEDVKYTLGADDVIKITVQKHPEFSGTYTVNLEGKIQMEMVGDIVVNGLTKREVEEKISNLIGSYIDNADISATIMEYKSKVYYVLGEVGHPGKFFMRSESISVREAVVDAGLPTLAAAMRKCRLITPAGKGKVKTQKVDLYDLLYGGNLDKNIEMRPGDFLYVPSTVMAKVFRVIAPVTEPVTSAASAQSGVSTLSTPLPKN